MALLEKNLERWTFQLGEEESCLEKGREVTIPHTWNVEEGSEEYWGTGWYRCQFTPEADWQNKRVRVLFRGVYHDAYVYLNGEKVCEHKNSGFTPFTAELTGVLKPGQVNSLVVKADNCFTNTMLPCNRSFDWANDGGMIRPAILQVTGRNLMKSLQVTAKPVITAWNERQEEGAAVFGLQGKIDRMEESLCGRETCSLEWKLYEGCDKDKRVITGGKELCSHNHVSIPGKVLDKVRYWHFDNPCLYTLELCLQKDGQPEDIQEIVFGFRDFHMQGKHFYLNGEPVRLTGTEWMPGSDPVYGMAEPKEQLEKMLHCLRESNSVFTRFHWQQDDWVYDWCDRHGLLVQEEVPFWGQDPEVAGEQQWRTFCQQIEEMVEAHRNHPSVIAWGVGNELDAQAKETVQYIKDAVAYTHELDPNRPANYVTNSIYSDPAYDGTTDGDVMMINDYIGTWHGDLDTHEQWDAIVKANPDKAMIPSEFGLCEPAFSGGDARREDIFLEKMACYRQYPNIAATVYFCLNDYRTQMGEDGEGKLRKRVHGSTGLCGEPKPSYYAVKREYAPLKAEVTENGIKVSCKDTLPCYTAKGYKIQIQEQIYPIPDLKPGESWETEAAGVMPGAEVKILRPGI